MKAIVEIFFCCNMKGSHKLKHLLMLRFEMSGPKKNLIMDNMFYMNQINRFGDKKHVQKIVYVFYQEMNEQNRYILCFLDNVASHKTDYVQTNIELLFLPPGSASTTHQLDQGMVKFQTILL